MYNDKAKVFVFEKQFKGLPKKGDLKLVTEYVKPLSDGEFLVEAIYLSLDPYMRSFATRLHLGKPFVGEQIARIIESRNKNYPVGKYVIGEFGWRTLTNGTEKPSPIGFPAPRILTENENVPLSLYLGILGMPGHTAYFGLLDVCKPKENDTVVVSTAGGAVGSHVGQIAKIKGCKVIGITGSDEKCKWLMEELQFDAGINYNHPNFYDILVQATPNGVDCYFDGVGGNISSIILTRMNKFGRIAVCGSISSYNCGDNEYPKAKEVQTFIKIRHLRMEGFSVFKYINRWNESLAQNLKWLKEGKLKYKETITEGFENAPDAFIDMLQGGNIGKAIVKI